MNSQFIPIEISSTAKTHALIAKFFAVLKVQETQDKYFEQVQIQLEIVKNVFFNEFIAEVSENVNDLWLLSEDEIGVLRKAILSWMKDNLDDEMHELLHRVLILIAQERPINTTDPITLEEIDITSRIVTSDGYQFDGESLIAFINNKNDWSNPFTRQKFSDKDCEIIRDFAKTHHLSLEFIYSRPEVDELPTMFLNPPTPPLAGHHVLFNHPTIFHAEDIRLSDRRIHAHFMGQILAHPPIPDRELYDEVMFIDNDVLVPVHHQEDFGELDTPSLLRLSMNDVD